MICAFGLVSHHPKQVTLMTPAMNERPTVVLAADGTRHIRQALADCSVGGGRGLSYGRRRPRQQSADMTACLCVLMTRGPGQPLLAGPTTVAGSEQGGTV